MSVLSLGRKCGGGEVARSAACSTIVGSGAHIEEHWEGSTRCVD